MKNIFKISLLAGVLAGCTANSRPIIITSEITCQVLTENLPTWSSKDSRKTLIDANKFLQVFNSVCNKEEKELYNNGDKQSET